MLTETQALKELNKWSDWDTGTPNSTTVSHSGGGPLPGSGASGRFAIPLQHHFGSAHRSPYDSWSPVVWGSLQRGSPEPWLYISNWKNISCCRQQHLLRATIHIPDRLCPLWWLRLLLAEGTAPARGMMSHCLSFLRPPCWTTFLLNPRLSFCICCNSNAGLWSWLSRASLWLSHEQNSWAWVQALV